jgi:hypothetical protein
VIRAFTALAFAATLCLASCASDGPTPEELQEQVRRGVSGEGQLGPIDRSNDPYVKPRGGASVSGD